MESSNILQERPTVLLLAAGKSERFGNDKRRASFDARKTLLEKALNVYQSRGLLVHVCLSSRPEDDYLESLLSANQVPTMRCTNAGQGMGATLSEAVNRLAPTTALFVALADMPLITSATLELLEENSHPDRIVYPVYRGRRGHPVVFGSRFLPLLQTLEGDRGASLVLERCASDCYALDVPDPGVILDVDTRADLERLKLLIQERDSAGESG